MIIRRGAACLQEQAPMLQEWIWATRSDLPGPPCQCISAWYPPLYTEDSMPLRKVTRKVSWLQGCDACFCTTAGAAGAGAGRAGALRADARWTRDAGIATRATAGGRRDACAP